MRGPRKRIVTHSLLSGVATKGESSVNYSPSRQFMPVSLNDTWPIGHNLKEPRIYVESGYRNKEWETMREFLKNYS